MGGTGNGDGEFPVNRLSGLKEHPAGFWWSFAPYLSRSSLLRRKFLEYCEDESVVLGAPELVALSRLGPESSLLLDCCKRVLTAEFDAQGWTPLDAARSMVVASKCVAKHFSEDSSAVTAIIVASDSLRARGRRLKKRLKENMGECRRHAPSPNAFRHAGTVTRLQGATWPTTEGHDYCGEFQLTGQPVTPRQE